MKLSYSKMGRMGRLGNMMFEIASLYGLSKRYNREIELPIDWKYNKYFKNRIPIGQILPFDNDLNEPSFSFPGWQWWDEEISKRSKDFTISIGGWLQSPKYWEGVDVKNELFAFENQYVEEIRKKYSHIFENGKETIAISVRIGQDYKDNGNYEILPITYYIRALYQKFDNWENGNYNILVFSDDIEYCKANLESEYTFFAEEETDINQLIMGTFCTHFILANSTFSWWLGYLGEKENSKIVRPSHYFKGELLKQCSTRDFWPEHWEEIEVKDKFENPIKLNLADVTFTIPVTYDHSDRLNNLNLLIDYLSTNFYTSIIVGENNGAYFRDGKYDWIGFSYKDFHRTKMLNDLANEADTTIIVNQDADVITPVFQLYRAAMRVREGATMVFPYDGRMARVNREEYFPILKKELDPGYLKKKEPFKGCRSFDPLSVGGVVMWKKEDFIYGGMENENMINYGPEDVERVVRFTKLGYRIERIKGPCYHIDHWVGPNSGGPGNPHFNNNHIELKRIEAMDNNQLLEEINKWEWVNTYLAGDRKSVV